MQPACIHRRLKLKVSLLSRLHHPLHSKPNATCGKPTYLMTFDEREKGCSTWLVGIILTGCGSHLHAVKAYVLRSYACMLRCIALDSCRGSLFSINGSGNVPTSINEQFQLAVAAGYQAGRHLR